MVYHVVPQICSPKSLFLLWPQTHPQPTELQVYENTARLCFGQELSQLGPGNLTVFPYLKHFNMLSRKEKDIGENPDKLMNCYSSPLQFQAT